MEENDRELLQDELDGLIGNIVTDKKNKRNKKIIIFLLILLIPIVILFFIFNSKDSKNEDGISNKFMLVEKPLESNIPILEKSIETNKTEAIIVKEENNSSIDIEKVIENINKNENKDQQESQKPLIDKKNQEEPLKCICEYPDLNKNIIELYRELEKISAKVNKLPKDFIKDYFLGVEELKNKIKKLESKNNNFKKSIKENKSNKTQKQVNKDINSFKGNIKNVKTDLSKFDLEIENLKREIEKLKQEDKLIHQKIDENVQIINNRIEKTENKVEIVYKEVFKVKPFVVKTIIEDQMAIISNDVKKIKLYKNNEVEINEIKYMVSKIDKNCVSLVTIKSERVEKICK